MEKGSSLNNYKGIYHEQETEKYFCPKTGAHFKFGDFCKTLEKIRLARAILEQPATIEISKLSRDASSNTHKLPEKELAPIPMQINSLKRPEIEIPKEENLKLEL
jgi:hypothetical protein